MAIKKPGSRFTDRNRIRKLHAEGFSIDQIASTVSIIPEHVTYVIEEWDVDEEKAKDKDRATREAAIAESRKGQVPANFDPAAERDKIKQELMSEMRAEMKAEMKAANGKAQVADEKEAEKVEESEENPRARRRKKAEVEPEFVPVDRGGNPLEEDEDDAA